MAPPLRSAVRWARRRACSVVVAGSCSVGMRRARCISKVCTMEQTLELMGDHLAQIEAALAEGR
jgi:hypothetical protein